MSRGWKALVLVQSAAIVGLLVLILRQGEYVAATQNQAQAALTQLEIIEAAIKAGKE